MSMFCYQCEQTAKGCGCTVMGVCGKDETVAKLQDLLIHVAKGIARFSKCSGEKSKEIDKFIIEALFTTVTNVNFDAERLKDTVLKGRKIALDLKEKSGGNSRGTGEKDFRPPEVPNGELIDRLILEGRELGETPEESGGNAEAVPRGAFYEFLLSGVELPARREKEIHPRIRPAAPPLKESPGADPVLFPIQVRRQPLQVVSAKLKEKA